jgi:hypothetical protein
MMSGPLDGAQVCYLLATLYVALSFILSTLGCADPTGGFCLRTLSFSRPTAIVGPILDMVAISSVVQCMICEE